MSGAWWRQIDNICSGNDHSVAWPQPFCNSSHTSLSSTLTFTTTTWSWSWSWSWSRRWRYREQAGSSSSGVNWSGAWVTADLRDSMMELDYQQENGTDCSRDHCRTDHYRFRYKVRVVWTWSPTPVLHTTLGGSSLYYCNVLYCTRTVYIMSW